MSTQENDSDHDSVWDPCGENAQDTIKNVSITVFIALYLRPSFRYSVYKKVDIE